MQGQSHILVEARVLKRNLVWAPTGIYVIQLWVWTLMVVKRLVEDFLGCSLLDSSDLRSINHDLLWPWFGVISNDSMGRATANTTLFWVCTLLWVLCHWPQISISGLIRIRRALRSLNLPSDFCRRNNSAICSWSRFFAGSFKEVVILWRIADVMFLFYLVFLRASRARHQSVLWEYIHFFESAMTQRAIFAALILN